MKPFDVKKYYKEFEYPKHYLVALELNLTNFYFWCFMDLLGQDHIERRIKHLQEWYPTRKLIPFARRYDCDDIACFEVGKGEEVQIIHDFATAGWEQIGNRKYESFWAWMKAATEELITNYDDYEP